MTGVSIAQRVADEIDRSSTQLIEWLAHLVRIPSITCEEGPAQALVARTLGDADIPVDVWDLDPDALESHPGFRPTGNAYKGRPNVVGTLRGTGGGRSLLLNAHVDVVPIEDPARWVAGPWSADIIDGRLFGRGASDMKAGLAAMLWAVRALRSTTRLRGDIIFESVIEEESTGNGTLAAVVRGYTAEGAVVGEPTSLDFVPGHGGVMWFEITVPGRSAHAGYRTRGVNAIEKAMVLYWALRDLETRRNAGRKTELYPHVDIPAPISIGVLESGHWPGTVPDLARMRGRIGVHLGESVDTARADLLAAIDVTANADSFLSDHRPLVKFLDAGVASSVLELDHPFSVLARGVLDRVAPAHGMWAKTPGTDMRHLMRFGSTPTVIVGPGDDELAHTANESVDVRQVADAAKFYALLALEWSA
jgi:acetylornithine deacetylase